MFSSLLFKTQFYKAFLLEIYLLNCLKEILLLQAQLEKHNSDLVWRSPFLWDLLTNVFPMKKSSRVPVDMGRCCSDAL